MARIICIDPGHGGSDPGAVNGRRYEKDDNLRLALVLKQKLEQQGHTVVLTHVGLGSTTKLSLEDRRQTAIQAKADLFVSLHRNSFASPTARGIEIWIRNTAYLQAATEVLERLTAIEHQGNRGIKVGTYQVLYNMPMPAVLVELGFISNPRDNDLFDQHIAANAEAIARGILAAVGENWRESTAGTEPDAPLYRVQVGAFRVRENAERFLLTVRDMGLEAFLVAPEATKKEEA